MNLRTRSEEWRKEPSIGREGGQESDPSFSLRFGDEMTLCLAAWKHGVVFLGVGTHEAIVALKRMKAGSCRDVGIQNKSIKGKKRERSESFFQSWAFGSSVFESC